MQDCGHTPEWTGPVVERVMRNGKRIYDSGFKFWVSEGSTPS
jgi:transposase